MCVAVHYWLKYTHLTDFFFQNHGGFKDLPGWPRELCCGGNPSHVALVKPTQFGPGELGPMAKTFFFIIIILCIYKDVGKQSGF